MEKINRSLNKLANTNQFQQRYEKLKQEIFEDEQVRLFLNANSSTVTEDMIEKTWGSFMSSLHKAISAINVQAWTAASI